MPMDGRMGCFVVDEERLGKRLGADAEVMEGEFRSGVSH
jgi:hypothetical protein